MLFHESNIIKIIKLGVYAVLFLPLIVVPLLFFPFSTSKAFLFQAIVEIIFALYFIVALKNPEYRPKKTLLFYAVSFYFIALLLSAVFGLDFYHSFFGNYERMWGFFQLLHFFLFFVILAGIFKTKEDWLKLIKVALLSGALNIGFGLFQFIGSLIYTGVSPRISGTVGNPAFFASYLLFPLFFSLLLFFNSKYNVIGRRYIYLLLSLFSLFAILFTATRGALVGLGAVAIAAAFLALLFIRRKSVRILSGLFLILVVAGIGLLFWQGSLFQKPERISQEQFYDLTVSDAPIAEQGSNMFGFLNRLTRFSLYDTTTQTRLIAWKSALGALRDYPLLGVGPENFVLAFNRYFNPDFYTYEKYEIWFDRAHNIYIETLTTLGPLGFVAYLFIFAVCFHSVFSLYRKREIDLPQVFVLTLFFVAYAVQNVFLFDSFAVFLVFMFAIAYLNGLSIKAKPMYIGLALVNSQFLLSIFIPTIAIIYFFTAKPAMESYYISKAESGEYGIDQATEYYKKALSHNTFGDNEARSRLALAVARTVQATEEEHLPPSLLGHLDFALSALEQNIKQSNEYYLLYRLQLADLYNLKLSRTALASPEIEDIIKKSIAISPGRMEFEFALAQAEFLKGNFTEAIRILAEAAKKNPDHPMPYWKISQNYHFMGDDDKAIPFLESAFYRGQSVKNPKEIMWAEQYYVKKENYSKIIFIDKLLLDQSPDQKESVRLHINLAVAYAKLGEKDQAIEHAQKVFEIDPTQKEMVAAFLQAL